MEFIELINNKTEIMNSFIEEENLDREKDSNRIENFIKENLLYKNSKLEDLCLNFLIPGSEIEMMGNGENTILSSNNIEEYMNRLLNSFCYEGIKYSIEAFKKGFNVLFPYTALNCFSSGEISEFLLGNSREQWDFETLNEYVIPNHGYDKSR